MRRTTIYLDPDLELRLKREAQRQQRPMAELIREALRQGVADAPDRPPPGAGEFASGKTDTAAKADVWLTRSGFGRKS
ncbi:MAG TPA: CopG family transcriptional regulator [Vicinamibacterales bacterium]